VIPGAADTFRAAAIEQLKTWGERLDIDVIAAATGFGSRGSGFRYLQSFEGAPAVMS